VEVSLTDSTNTNLVFLSLHDVKDHKGPNQYPQKLPAAAPPDRRWICARGCGPPAKGRQTQDPECKTPTAPAK